LYYNIQTLIFITTLSNAKIAASIYNSGNKFGSKLDLRAV